ncbi:hypothetical protein V6N11_034325 [Hibiscus sabdariffa]|uniref:Uncharacterized protein n=1 Tax=Hibiscus sabdariffa TaxID=183260 RepID=A0ABR2A3S3_9ROSI
MPWGYPLPRPASLSVVEAIYAEGSMGRPLWPGHASGSARGLLVVAKGASPARSRCFGCARSWCASRYLGSRLWILISWPIGASWLCLKSSWGCWTVPRAPPWLVTLALLDFGASGLGCGLSSWPLMTACMVAARWLDAWLCP